MFANTLHHCRFLLLSFIFASQATAMPLGRRFLPSDTKQVWQRAAIHTHRQRKIMTKQTETTKDIFFDLVQKERWSHRSMKIYAYDSHSTGKHFALLEGYCDALPELEFPVRFYENKRFPYKKKREFLCSNIGVPLLISDGFKKILEEHQITGWKTYPAVLIGRDDQEVKEPKYHGFTITGRGGPRDINYRDSKEDLVTGHGIYIDPATWDGSDIFLERDLWAGRFLSQRAAKVFAKQKEMEAVPISKALYLPSTYKTYKEKIATGYYRPYYSSAWIKREGAQGIPGMHIKQEAHHVMPRAKR